MEQKCPKCGSTLLSQNEDGDLECVCGYIIYKELPNMSYETKIVEKARKDVEAGKTYDEVRNEVAKITGKTPSKSTINSWVNPNRDILKEAKARKDVQKLIGEKLKDLASKKLSHFKHRIATEAVRYKNYIDPYYEVMVDLTSPDELLALFNLWVIELKNQQLNEFNKGVIFCLETLRDFFQKIEEMRPKDFEE